MIASNAAESGLIDLYQFASILIGCQRAHSNSTPINEMGNFRPLIVAYRRGNDFIPFVSLTRCFSKAAFKIYKKLAENHVYFIDDVTVGKLGIVVLEATRKN